MKTPEMLKEKENSNDEEYLKEAVKSFKEQQKEEAPKRAAEFYKNVYDYQTMFENRLAKLKESDDKMNEKEFERWEDMLGDEIKLADKEIGKDYFSLEQKAEVMQKMITSTSNAELNKTVEAQAGNYYYERIGMLRDAIQSFGGEDAKKELEYLNGFYPAVMKHLEFKYLTPEEIQGYGAEMYDSKRTKSHNEVIKHLNGLNDLARKYGTRPLTFRNFWPSDLCNINNQTPAIADVMRYDRYTVEEYYTIAFSSDVRKKEREFERNQRWGF